LIGLVFWFALYYVVFFSFVLLFCLCFKVALTSPDLFIFALTILAFSTVPVLNTRVPENDEVGVFLSRKKKGTAKLRQVTSQDRSG